MLNPEKSGGIKLSPFSFISKIIFSRSFIPNFFLLTDASKDIWEYIPVNDIKNIKNNLFINILF